MGLFKDCGCGCDGKKQEQKFLISIMSALVFFVVANPETFRVMRKVFGSWVSNPTGCPSTGGLVLHTIVFMLVTWGMMNTKREGCTSSEPVKEEVVVASTVPVPVPGPPSQPKMVDMPSPLPGMSEEQFSMFDSGTNLGSMDVTNDSENGMY
jgi:hypothetical protein|tara:strand:- start:2487 stop:2942 length:456 start_codon:yes stop_codon:yes gene_type:complete